MADTVRVQIHASFYGLAGDIKGIDYVWPDPVPVDAEKFMAVVLALNGHKCASDRNARVVPGQIGQVEQRVRYLPGTCYSKFCFKKITN